MSAHGSQFFETLGLHQTFDDLTNAQAYEKLPDDWLVGMADIVGSTRLIESGEYKKINTIGAAVISAQINGAGGKRFPFIFGGDGASFAFWPEHEEAAKDALAAVRRWALSEFDVDLRAALVSVKTIREAGHDVSVARYSPSSHLDYAMFSGGGLSWAEEKMKNGEFSVPLADEGVQPNLEGLSCRWTPMENTHGRMLSLVVAPQKHASARAVTKIMREIVAMTDKLEASGNPVNAGRLQLMWSRDGADIEAHTLRGAIWFLRRIRAYSTVFLAYFFMRTGLKVGSIDPKRYRKITEQNADFRKFDDGLKLTIDCDASTASALQKLLEKARDKGIITFGLVEQEAALLTCIVPSVKSDDHIHFVDGASGGYAAAAAQMKLAQKAA